MISHFIRITVISVVVLTCMFLPFLPGSYDGLAVTLSTIAQLFAVTSLLLLPIGLVWLFYEIGKQRKKDQPSAQKNRSHQLATITFVTACIATAAIPIGAFANDQRSFAVITLLLCLYVLNLFFRNLKKMKQTTTGQFNLIPFYLICIPIVITLTQFLFLAKAVEFSRNHVINQSKTLIQDIESYYQTNGHYPVSMLSVWKDYKPSIIGVKQYHYEPNGKAYNLYFEQFSNSFGTREFVMYNKLDEHEMTSHDMDLLQFSGAQLNMQRGYYGKYDLPQPHWKYFRFD